MRNGDQTEGGARVLEGNEDIVFGVIPQLNPLVAGHGQHGGLGPVEFDGIHLVGSLQIHRNGFVVSLAKHIPDLHRLGGGDLGHEMGHNPFPFRNNCNNENDPC